MLHTVRMGGILLQFTGPIHTDDEEERGAGGIAEVGSLVRGPESGSENESFMACRKHSGLWLAANRRQPQRVVLVLLGQPIFGT
jgi:hypothetical protein